LETNKLHKQILETSNSWSTPRKRSKEELLAKTFQNIELNEKRKSSLSTTNKFSFSLRIAASIAIVLGLSISAIYIIGHTHIQTKLAERKNIILPDGSQVEMNSASDIHYNRYLFALNRNIELEGEAFFQVQKGSSFKVISPNAKIEVLGTSFNVKSRNLKTEVYCKTGKVKLSCPEGKSHILVPGQKASVTETHLSKYTEKAKHSNIHWRNDEYYFSAERLEKVFEEIRINYDIQFQLSKKIEGRTFSGHFPKQSLSDDLKMICIPMGLQYKIEGNNVIIR